MIYTTEQITTQINNLLITYPKLKVKEISEFRIVISGKILVNRYYKDFNPYKEYEIEVVIPLNSDKLPFVIDIGNNIDKNYPHIYKYTRQLCLSTDTDIRIHFIDKFDIVEWIKNYVEIYYFSYEYYNRYGIFPFGERSHGNDGILETYCDLFDVKNKKSALQIMEYIANKKYRGHIVCPCGSGKRLRNCHGKVIRKYINNHKLKNIVTNDLKDLNKRKC